MPTYSMADGVGATYEVAAGATAVTISSRERLKHRGVSVGTGQMLFHWVSTGKTQVWRCDLSMINAAPAQAEETTGQDGVQQLKVPLGEVYPAGLVLQGSVVGTLLSPAIHVDIPFGTDLWVFLVKSPWFPLKLRVDKPILSVAHGSSRATASLSAQSDGSLLVQLAVDGTDFKQATLEVKRTLGMYSSTESVCEAAAGTQTTVWTPIVRAFDLLLVTKGEVSERHIVDVGRGLGAQISSGLLSAGTVEGDFVLCDGPATTYSMHLKGHRGFLENEEDATGARFTW